MIVQSDILHKYDFNISLIFLYISGTTYVYDQNPKMCLGQQEPHFGDFNGDGYTDLLCFDRGDGHIWIWLADSDGYIQNFNNGWTGWFRKCSGTVFIGKNH